MFLSVLQVDAVRARQNGDLADAVAYYHDHATSDYVHMLEATHRFEAVAGRRPDDWLPAYWTAFAYSQLGLFSNDERIGPYIDLANVYYDKSWSLYTPGDSVSDADFFALKGLIMGFVASADSANAVAHRQTMGRFWDRARATDPHNPMAMMDQSLRLLPDRTTRSRAYDLIERTIELYEPRLGSTRPNWGREFLDVWMGNYPRNPGSKSDVAVVAQTPGGWR